MDAREFYDEYVTYQERVGVNERHHAILRALQRDGLHTGHHVLEIGCGVGTLTELLAATVREGCVTGVDLSPKSIDAAEARLAACHNVRLLADDVVDMRLDDEFDVVVLPDVIEHIPLERHSALFGRVASWVKPTGFVLLNYPNPHYLAWCQQERPHLLQVIDQPIHADVLLSNARPHGLYLDSLQTYSIWVQEGDYVLAVLRPLAGIGAFTPIPQPPPSPLGRIHRRIRRLFG